MFIHVFTIYGSDTQGVLNWGVDTTVHGQFEAVDGLRPFG